MKWSIYSWNINGIRSITQKGLPDWLEQVNPHVICLQEIKAKPHQFPDDLLETLKSNNYEFDIHSAERPGYSGVATFIKKTRYKKLLCSRSLEISDYDIEGRVRVYEFQNFVLYNCYLPNGGRDHSRVNYKLKCSEAMLQDSLKANKPVVLCGDFNTAHEEIDLANPKSNHKTTGFLPHERKWIDRLIDHDYCDIYRQQVPDENGHYTWWSYRNNCRSRNIGWRIDYFFVRDPKNLLNSIRAKLHPNVLGSDHCPLSLDFKTP